MSDDLVSRLRQDAEMLQDGPQSNLTKLWHSEVVKDAAKDCQEAATALTEARAEIERLREQVFELEHGVEDQMEEAAYHAKQRAAAESELSTLRAALEGGKDE